MSLQSNLVAMGKEKSMQMKALVEELELQMALGKAEARDVIKEEQKNLKKFINQQKVEMNRSEKTANEHREVLNKKFIDLETAVSKELPTTKRKFDAYKKETLHSIYELEYQLKESYGDVSPDIQTQLNKFKVKLDGYRVQLALANLEDEAQLNNRKAELQTAIDSIQEKMNKEIADRGKVENFVDEVTESFDHMKKAFSDLFS